MVTQKKQNNIMCARTIVLHLPMQSASIGNVCDMIRLRLRWWKLFGYPARKKNRNAFFSYWANVNRRTEHRYCLGSIPLKLLTFRHPDKLKGGESEWEKKHQKKLMVAVGWTLFRQTSKQPEWVKSVTGGVTKIHPQELWILHLHIPKTIQN